MPTTKGTPLKVVSSGASANTPTPSKPGSPAANPQVLKSSPSIASASAVQLETVSNPHELTAFVETVLKQLEERFDETSTQVLDRMSQMSSRLDSLETSIQELLDGEMSIPGSPTPDTPIIKTQSLRGNAQ